MTAITAHQEVLVNLEVAVEVCQVRRAVERRPALAVALRSLGQGSGWRGWSSSTEGMGVGSFDSLTIQIKPCSISAEQTAGWVPRFKVGEMFAMGIFVGGGPRWHTWLTAAPLLSRWCAMSSCRKVTAK
jgi:hypothetical protein